MRLFWKQNYFGDPWNVLDFVIVIGSIVDIVAGRVLVSKRILESSSARIPNPTD